MEKKHTNAITFIDLFAGAGGLSLGFEKLSRYRYTSVWANDFNKHACNTYRLNFNNQVYCGDIEKKISEDITAIPQADIVIGGPPCQGFSLLNKKRGNDARKSLWKPFLTIVEHARAKAFVIENVPQLLSSDEYHEIVEYASNLGFALWSGVLTATDYGVPQQRKRAFIIGSKHTDPALFFPPKKTHYAPQKRTVLVTADARTEYAESPAPWNTVRTAISDLPDPVGTQIRDIAPPLDLQFGRNPTEKSILRYKAIPEQGMNRVDLYKNAPELTPKCWINKKGGTDLFGRLWWDRPSVTIRTEFFKPEKGRYLHPEKHRPITHREAARLQTFPDNFIFTGSKAEVAKQIGNAVPPLLAKHIADTLYHCLDIYNGCF